jgi:hypothetical protein
VCRCLAALECLAVGRCLTTVGCLAACGCLTPWGWMTACDCLADLPMPRMNGCVRMPGGVRVHCLLVDA